MRIQSIASNPLGGCIHHVSPRETGLLPNSPRQPWWWWWPRRWWWNQVHSRFLRCRVSAERGLPVCEVCSLRIIVSWIDVVRPIMIAHLPCFSDQNTHETLLVFDRHHVHESWTGRPVIRNPSKPITFQTCNLIIVCLFIHYLSTSDECCKRVAACKVNCLKVATTRTLEMKDGNDDDEDCGANKADSNLNWNTIRAHKLSSKDATA